MAPLHILIAQREPLSALALRTQIHGLGHRAIGPAGSDEQAMALARSERIDLAILDLELSAAREQDLASRVFQARPIPIIALTEYDDEDVAGSVSRGAVFHHLVKPVSVDALGPAIDLATRRFRAWRALRGGAVEI